MATKKIDDAVIEKAIEKAKAALKAALEAGVSARPKAIDKLLPMKDDILELDAKGFSASRIAAIINGSDDVLQFPDSLVRAFIIAHDPVKKAEADKKAAAKKAAADAKKKSDEEAAKKAAATSKK